MGEVTPCPEGQTTVTQERFITNVGQRCCLDTHGGQSLCRPWGQPRELVLVFHGDRCDALYGRMKTCTSPSMGTYVITRPRTAGDARASHQKLRNRRWAWGGGVSVCAKHMVTRGFAETSCRTRGPRCLTQSGDTGGGSLAEKQRWAGRLLKASRSMSVPSPTDRCVNNMRGRAILTRVSLSRGAGLLRAAGLCSYLFHYYFFPLELTFSAILYSSQCFLFWRHFEMSLHFGRI